MKTDSKTDVRKTILDTIRKELPPYFRINGQTIFNHKTLYNLMSQGRGPAVSEVGGIKLLERESFLAWLDNRSCLKRGRKKAAAA